MPMESGLEFIAAIGPDHLDAEGELLDHVGDEVDGVGLIAPVVDLQGPDTCGVVDGGVLVPLDRGAIFVLNVRNLTSTWIWCPGTRFWSVD